MKKQGISLITLVITIVIIIILVGAVILNLTDNNPIKNAKKARVFQDIDTFKTELILKMTTGYTNGIFDLGSINAVTRDDILKYVPSIENKKIGKILYTDILVISEGTLAVDGENANEHVSNGKLTKEQYDWIVEALGNNVFNAQTYSIKYYTNDGTEEYTESSKIHNVKYSILSNTKERVGYGFKNWNTKKDGTGTTYNVGDEYTENAELVLYAQWKAGTYTVTYHKNDGTDDAKADLKTTDVEYTITDQKFTREGYIFKGFNTVADGTGNDYQIGSSYTENKALELYAKWEIITYTVTYNPNSGTGAPNNQTKTYGIDLALSMTKPVRSGYTFNGWNTSLDGTGTNYAPGADYVENSNLELYAQWKANVVYALSVKTNPSTYYGAYVDYTVPNKNCTVEWRVFYADNNNIYLIAADYVPNNCFTGFNKSTNEKNNLKNYCVFSDTRENLVNNILLSSNFSTLKNTTYADDVKGGPTIEQFILSYNAAVQNKQFEAKSVVANEVLTDFSDLYGDNKNANASGYVVRVNSNQNTGSYMYFFPQPGYTEKDGLYQIHSNENASGYWIASYSAYSNDGVINMYQYGSGNWFNCYFEEIGLRPIVKLNSNVAITGPDANGRYTLTK